MTINRFCSSGLQAIALAAERNSRRFPRRSSLPAVTESMSMVPMGRQTKFRRIPGLVDNYPDAYINMGAGQRENIAPQIRGLPAKQGRPVLRQLATRRLSPPLLLEISRTKRFPVLKWKNHFACRTAKRRLSLETEAWGRSKPATQTFSFCPPRNSPRGGQRMLMPLAKTQARVFMPEGTVHRGKQFPDE